MRKLALTVILIFASFISFSQTQRGYVKTRGRIDENGDLVPGKCLSGVVINIKGNPSVTSDANGNFSFSLLNNTFIITNVYKDGYQLCNENLFNERYEDPDNELIVVMDTQKKLSEYRVELEQRIRRICKTQIETRKSELIDMKRLGKINEEQFCQKLQEVYSSQEYYNNCFPVIMNIFSALDFDQIDNSRRKAIALILNGELGRADSLLNAYSNLEERSTELDSRLSNPVNEDKQKNEHFHKSDSYKRDLENFALDCNLKFSICLMQHQIDSAGYWIQLRASKDRFNIQWQLDAGDYFTFCQSDYDTALSFFNSVLDLSISEYGERSSLGSSVYNSIGNVFYKQREYIKGLEFVQRSLDIKLELFGEYSLPVAEIYSNLGFGNSLSGAFSTASNAFLQSLEICKSLLGDNNIIEADIFASLGVCYYYMGQYDQAVEFCQKSIDLYRSFKGETLQSVAWNYMMMGITHIIKGDSLGAEVCLNKAIEIQKNIFGEIHPDIAVCYSTFADVYASKGDYKKAAEYYENTLKIRKAIYGDSHTIVANTLQVLGITYCHLMQHQKAIRYLQDSLEILEDAFDMDDVIFLVTYQWLGVAFSNLGEYKEAHKYYRFAIQVASHNNDESALSDLYMGLGMNSLLSGNFKESLEYYDRAIAMKSSRYGKTSSEAAHIYTQVGLTYLKWQCLPEALKYLQTSHRILLSLPSNSTVDKIVLYSTIYGLGSVYLLQEDYPNALEYFKMSHPIVLETYGENSNEEFQLGTAIGLIYLKLGEYTKSFECLKDVLMRQTSLLGKDYPTVTQTLNLIEVLYIEANEAGIELPPMEKILN